MHKCDICLKAFRTVSDLKRHVTRVHKKPDKNIQCNTCQTKFFTLKELERHSVQHEGQIFKCPVK